MIQPIAVAAARAGLTQALGASMTVIATFVLLLAASSPGGSDVCKGIENEIEPDMRILESDLTQKAAEQAAAKLKDMIQRNQITGEYRYGAMNQSKILQGHILLRDAQDDRKKLGPDSQESQESRAAFCKWLGSEGFWYD